MINKLIFIFASFFLCQFSSAQALIQSASSDELVEKLSPNVSGMRLRGMRNLTPEAKDAPSVDLSIQFEFNSAQLMPESKPLLGNLAKAINSAQLKNYSFLVEGHTDIIGTPEYNQNLSIQRANAVLNYLSGLGVSKARLKAIGKGSIDLLVPDKPDAPENRRVKIIVNS